MLRITQQSSAAGAKSYYATADYYSEGQEIVGRWGGEAARLLGLDGTVDQDRFERLCDNRDPRTGGQLTARTRSDRTVGYDFTFSVPKSVSLLYALSGDRELLDALRSAVDETMRDIEAEMKARVRKGNTDTNRTTGNMVWAEFIHTTSRPVDGIPDPQMHAHCFCFNATWDETERQWKAGQFRDLKRDAPYFQAAFRTRLANTLQDLGYGIERTRDDFELAGVPGAVLGRFSRRTAVIEQTAAELGITDPDRKAELGASTREHKAKDLSWNELRREWDGRLTPAERQQLAAVHRRETPPLRQTRGEAMAVDYAIAHSFARAAVVPERKLVTEALKRGIGTVTVDGVRREVAGRPLIRGEIGGQALVTTPAMVGAEALVIDIAKQGRGRCRPLGDPDRPIGREWLNAGQQAAVRHVLGSRDRVTLIRGVAGSGKTTLLQEVGEGLAAAGRPVVALAPSATASRAVLRQAGFAEADTVAKFLVDPALRQQAKGGVVLVDEASLLGTADMLRVFEAAADVGARLVLIGDTKQHRAVAAGEPLAVLERRAGLPVANVAEIVRQGGDYKRATTAMSEGRIADGFAELDKLGWVREVPDADRYHHLADAYLAAVRKPARGREPTALVVSPTHAEKDRCTAAIRAGLKAAGQLGDERVVDTRVPAHLTDAQKTDPTSYHPGDLLRFYQHAPGYPSGTRLVVGEGSQPPTELASRFEVYRPARLAVAVGDRVRLTAGGKTRDGKRRLENGMLFTVQGFTPRGDLVVDRGWVIDRDWGHLDHGYAVTSFNAQGRSVDKVIIGQSAESFPASNARQFYVSVSRGAKACELFTDDKGTLLQAVSRADQPLAATDLALHARRTPPLARRLHKHLAFLRRVATFGHSHSDRDHARSHDRSMPKEATHER